MPTPGQTDYPNIGIDVFPDVSGATLDGGGDPEKQHSNITDKANQAIVALETRAGHSNGVTDGTPTPTNIDDVLSVFALGKTTYRRPRFRVSKAGTLIGSEPEINFIDGANVTSTISDNIGAKRFDVTLNASGGGSGSGQITNTKVVASSDATAAEKAAADYVCTGTNDEVPINAAITAVAPSLPISNTSGGGGVVQLVGKTFTIGNGQSTNIGSIQMKSQVYLRGQGKFSTWIKAASNFGNTTTPPGMIELFQNSGAGDAQFTYVSDLTLFGNVSAGARCMGISYSNTTNNVYQFSDAAHTIRDIYIFRPYSHGIFLDHGRATYISKVRVIDAGGSSNPGNAHGFNIATADGYIEGSEAGSCSGHGFFINSSNFRYVNCKSWFSDLSGFKVTSVRNQLIACEAQDNNNHGFEITSGFTICADAVADSNGFNGSSPISFTGSGFFIGATRSYISGAAYDKNEGGRGIYQHYGVEFSGQQSALQVFVTTNGNATDSVGGTAQTSASNTNCLIIADNDTSKTSYFKFSGGRFYTNFPNTAPSSAELGPSDGSMWFDEAASAIKISVKTSAGTLKTGTVCTVA